MSNTFTTAATKETTKTFTENGATAFNTTNNPLLDFFSVIGALRQADDNRIFRLFENAYQVNPLFAMKTLFYGRDIRGGLGEREAFRKILKYTAERYPEVVIKNLPNIGYYGRFDDLYSLIETPVEDSMWEYVKGVWETDLFNMGQGNPVSMLAKWVKTADASSEKTRRLGVYTAQKLGLTVYDYKRQYRELRKYIKVVEQLMTQGKWEEIEYSHVPSRAMKQYRNAFLRHDKVRMNEFLAKVSSGEEKINAATLYPYDVVKEYIKRESNGSVDNTLEAQWRQMLENFGDISGNALVIADTSGSMFWDNYTSISSAVALAILFANALKGDFHGLMMEFSSDSRFVKLKGNTLRDQITNLLADANWGNSTNLESAFKKILNLAVANNVPKEDMPKVLIVISDMEIDVGTGCSWSFHENMENMYNEEGYELPTVVYWNVNSRHDVYHIDSDRPGCLLVSGHSAGTFKNVINSADKTPVELMNEIINDERYNLVVV